MFKKEKAILDSHELDNDMIKYADTAVDYYKSFKNHDLKGQLLWELHCTKEVKYFVEKIKSFALLNFHTKMQLLNRSYQTGPMEVYLCGCLTKMSETRLEGSP